MNKRYEILQFLDEGGQGKVFLAYDKLTNHKVCIKQIKLPAIEEKRGIALTKNIHHPTLVKTLDTYEDGLFFYHVMEYIEGTCCSQLYKTMEKRQIRHITLQLLSLFQLFEKVHITFNDIKPDNLIFDEDYQIHLIDLGAILPERDTTSLRYGSMYFASVEYVQKKETTWQGDVYSLGKTIQFLSKKPFFFVRLWINKVTKGRVENRFKHLGKAIIYFKYDELFLKGLLVVDLLCGLLLYPTQNWAYHKELEQHNYLQAISVNPKLDEAYLLYFSEKRNYEEWLVLEKKDVIQSSDHVKMQLVDLLATRFDARGWELTKKLYKNCINNVAKKRLTLMDDLNVDYLRNTQSKSEIDFFMQCLFYQKNISVYLEVWDVLMVKEVYPKKDKELWLVNIAFELNRVDLLQYCVEEGEDDYVRALSYYRMFELGNYQSGYLHQAKMILRENTELWLYEQIEKLIQQWGSKA